MQPELLVDDSVWDTAPVKPLETYNEVFKRLCNHKVSIENIYGKVINIKITNLVQMITAIEYSSIPITENGARNSLRDLGIIIGRDGWIFIRNQNPIIESILGTKFWPYDLKKLKGVAASKQPRRFGDRSFKGLKLPLELFTDK